MGTKYIPEPIIVRTALDEHGSLLDVTRIPGEDLSEYSKRLFDAYSHRASSTYTGLINAINRELNLNRKDIMKVLIRGVGYGDIASSEIQATATTLKNTLSYSNLINGTSVFMVGSILTDNTMNWEPKTLRGFKIEVAGERYLIIDNTDKTVTIEGSVTNVVNETYSVQTYWDTGELIGLGIEIDETLYKIIENNEDTLRIESGDFTKVKKTQYKIRAFNPKVEVTASKFLLYKDYKNKNNFQLEKEINIREDVRFHYDIINEINKLKYFEAENLLDQRERVLSFTINRQSSEKQVIKEIVPAAKFFRLQNNHIKEGSIKFTEINIFLHEVIEEDVSKNVGNYNVDYSKGVVKVNTIPSGTKTVSYEWNDFPFTIQNSLAIINPLNKEDSSEFLFLQKEMERYTSPSERFKSSVPKADMIEYMAELLAVKPNNWGE